MSKKNDMNWNAKRVMVTGAGGFIGSHLVESLVKLGATVRAFVRYNSRGDIGLLKWVPQDVLAEIEIVAGDLRDVEAVSRATESMENIFHLGALIGIPYSYNHPRDVAETNILGTLNVLMACRRYDVPKIIHTSTSEVYGSAKTVPITEEHPLQGQSPYAASKIGADKIAESFYRSYGVQVCTVRPFNTYGPRQSDRAVIPTIISQALKENEIKLGSVWPKRDYTFVRDTVAGFIQAASCPNTAGIEVNLGSNQDISIGDLAKKILQLVNRNVPIIEESHRLRPDQSEVHHLRADYSRAQQLFDWKPAVSLEEGLSEVIQWVETHFELYEPSAYRV